MNKISIDWLNKKGACANSVAWFKAIFNKSASFKNLVLALIKDKKWKWSDWLIVRALNKTQSIKVAIFVAEQVIDIYEKKYPDDKRPRLTIEAAKVYLNKPTKKNRLTANVAAHVAAYTAAFAAKHAVYAAYAAAYDDMRTKILQYIIKVAL